MSEEIVTQIIAEIIAEDQMSSTLRDARKKIKAFDGDIKKLNKSLTAQEKSALEAAAADKKLAKESKAAALETKRLDAASKALAADGLKAATKAANTAAAAQRKLRDDTKSQIDGIKVGIGQLGISGEAMTSTFTAASFAIGALFAGAIKLASDALKAYIVQNKVAAKSADNLSKAWTKLQVAAVETQLGTTGMTKALDTNTARLNALTKALKPPTSEMARLTEEEEKFTQTGFTDSLQFQVSGIGLLTLGVGEAIDAFDDLFEIEKKTAAVSFKNLTDQLKGVGSEIDKIINKAREDNKKLDKEEADTAKRRREADEAEAKRSAAAFRRRKEVADKLSAKNLRDVLDLNMATAALKRHTDELKRVKDVLDEFEPSAEDTGFGGDFGTQRTGFAQFAGDVVDPAKDSLEGIITPTDAAADATSLWLQETVELDDALQSLATGGVAVLTDAVGDYIQAMAAGTDGAFHFGDAVQLGFGSLLREVGAGMIALSTAALMVQTGGILANPIAGIALGGVLVASGAALMGNAQKRIGSRGAGGGTAKQVAGEVADIVTSRIGTGFERGKDRAGDNIQVIIGERPIRDITIRSVREAITNREIPTLSVAGQSI